VTEKTQTKVYNGFIIEKGIPHKNLPSNGVSEFTKKHLAFPYKQLEVGESFFVRLVNNRYFQDIENGKRYSTTKKKLEAIRARLYGYSKLCMKELPEDEGSKRKFESQAYSKPSKTQANGIRIWRTL
jgi:hypothetical protein